MAQDIGTWVVGKYRLLSEKIGVQQAAKNLRKQGYSLEQARFILLGV